MKNQDELFKVLREVEKNPKISQRKLAERALTKKHHSKKVQKIIEKVNAELDDRRAIKFSNATKSMLIIYSGD